MNCDPIYPWPGYAHILTYDVQTNTLHSRTTPSQCFKTTKMLRCACVSLLKLNSRDFCDVERCDAKHFRCSFSFKIESRKSFTKHFSKPPFILLFALAVASRVSFSISYNLYYRLDEYLKRHKLQAIIVSPLLFASVYVGNEVGHREKWDTDTHTCKTWERN